MGVTGASYGGALSLLLAGADPRVDATIPIITWNDLGQSLFPNRAGPDPATTPAASAAAPDGVFKRAWSALFFGSGSRPAPGQEQAPPQVCGRFVPEVCAGYVAAITTGREPAELASFFDRASPASVAGRITAPTLLVQGEQDTLFGLDQADATARQIAAGGGTVAVSWFAGGHDGGEPDQRTTDRMQAWFDHHLAGTGADPGAAFTYVVPSGVQARRAPTQRTITASVYPGLDGGPGTVRTPLPLRGEAQDVVAPAGGAPSAISSVPGLAGLAGARPVGAAPGTTRRTTAAAAPAGAAAAGRGGGGGGASALLGRLANDLPGQSARFSTDPLPARTVVAGTPEVRLTVSSVPGRGRRRAGALREGLRRRGRGRRAGHPHAAGQRGLADAPARHGTDADRGVGEPPRRGGDARRRPPPRGRRLDHRPGLRRRDRPGRAPDRPGR